MSSSINRAGILWALGILQPASASELSNYLSMVLPEAGSAPDEIDLQRFLIDASDMRQVVRVHRDPDLFSLTSHGNYYLSRKQRLSRDRERLFLLRDLWADRVVVSSEETFAGLDGAAQSANDRIDIQGSGANKPGPCVPRVRSYWPRISRQLIEETGPLVSSDDIFPDYLSFSTTRQLELARSGSGDKWDYSGIALSMGVSPLLLLRMAIKPEPNYRAFEIRKSSGSFRKIEAPRVFLKTVQRFIADYVLRDLPIHDAVHSFRRSRSSVTNAHVHRGSHWVGTIDIEDFFPSINEEAVQRLLMTNGFSVREATTIKRLCTYLGSLPQGGPASPVISNAILYESDVICASIAEGNGLKYSRYADDLTFSGDNKHQVKSAIDTARMILNSKHGMRINERKSRINGPSSRRSITGATISDSVLPPRKIRRNIRAACYNFSKEDRIDIVKLREVQGYLSYFESFPDFRTRSEHTKLREKLTVAKVKSRQIG